MRDPFDFNAPCDPPYELVEVERTCEEELPEAYQNKVLVHTVHDGGSIPEEFRFRADGTPIVADAVLRARYVEERDWGADLVAERLAGSLGLRGYTRCRIARVLIDFNRFPGTSPRKVDHHFERLAISHPFADALNHAQKMHLLSTYYDRISELIDEQILIGNLISIAVHTYDEHNPSETRRPALSIVSQSANYQRESRLPYGLFDPLYPDELVESTCSRVLRDRISLNLERSGFRVSHNHPYSLPEGSIEVRAQVWFFFRYLRTRFETDHPETRENSAYTLVWTMLLNTNLRDQEGEALRGYLHRYRPVSSDDEPRFGAAVLAYEHVRRYLREGNILADYRRSPARPSSLGLEVRKDLLCTFDPATGYPMRPNAAQLEVAATIGRVIASAIKIYFNTDRQFT